MVAPKAKAKFRPIDNFDVDDLPADLPRGKWKVRIQKVKVTGTADQDPMLFITYEVLKAFDKKNKSLEGKTVDERVIFYSPKKTERDRARKFNNIRMRNICEAFELDTDIIPKGKVNEETLTAYAEALENAEGIVWTSVKKDPERGDQTNVHYSAPSGLADTTDEDDDEEESEEEDSEEETEEEETDEEESDEEEEEEEGDEEEEKEAPPPPKRTAKKAKKK